MPVHDIIDNRSQKLVDHINELWEESQDFDEALMREMQQSWAVASSGLMTFTRKPRRSLQPEEQAIPRIICSENLG